MQAKQQGWLGLMGLLGCVLCWGAVPVLLRQLTVSMNAWTSNGIRYPLSALLYWPILIVVWQRGLLTRQLVGRTIVPAFFAWAGQVFWGLAPYYLTASSIGFFVRFSMIFAAIAAMVLFHDERALLRRPTFYVGMALVVGGFVWFAWSQGASQDPRAWTGVLIMMCCAFFFGLYGVSVRWYLHDVNPVLGFALVSQWVSAGTLVGLLVAGDVHNIPLVPGDQWLRLIASSVLGIGLGHIFMYAAVLGLGAAVTSAVQTLTPFVTAIIASLVLGEVLSGDQWRAGFVMVGGAVVLIAAQRWSSQPRIRELGESVPEGS